MIVAMATGHGQNSNEMVARNPKFIWCLSENPRLSWIEPNLWSPKS